MVIIACIFLLVFSIRARFRPRVFSYAGTFTTSLGTASGREDTNLTDALKGFRSRIRGYDQMTNILACALGAIAALCLWHGELARGK